MKNAWYVKNTLTKCTENTYLLILDLVKVELRCELQEKLHRVTVRLVCDWGYYYIFMPIDKIKFSIGRKSLEVNWRSEKSFFSIDGFALTSCSLVKCQHLNWSESKTWGTRDIVKNDVRSPSVQLWRSYWSAKLATSMKMPLNTARSEFSIFSGLIRKR